MPEEELALLTPVPVAFLVCDQISVDRTSGKKTIVGIFDRVWVGQFPAVQSPWLYLRVIDAQGKYLVKFEYVQVSKQTVLSEGEAEITSSDRHQYTDLVLNWPAMPIPEPGEYEFRVWMNNKFISSARLTARPRSEMEAPA